MKSEEIVNSIAAVKNLPAPVLTVLGILVVCQLIVMVWACVHLVGDKREHVVGLPRLVWAPFILLGGLIGSTVFLILHIREQSAIAEQRRYHNTHHQADRSQGKRTSTVISSLYEA